MTQTRIVIPCYNEAARLDRERFRGFARRCDTRFLFVNDGSSDATAEMLDGLQRSDPGQFDVLHLPVNRGKAEAVRQGMLRSIATGAEWVGFWDADLSTPIEAVSEFKHVLERRADIRIVLGTRLPILGRSIQRRWKRRHAGLLFARCASAVIGFPVVDTQCGAKLFRIDDTTRGLFDKPFASRWIFDVEVLVRWRRTCERLGVDDMRGRIFELPLDAWTEVPGSKLRGRDFLRAIGELWRIWRESKIVEIADSAPAVAALSADVPTGAAAEAECVLPTSKAA
ncbi:MAG TPA: glycosyltransferase [Gemmataceae bacterium]|jgi:glycosyltransferase involved in cell wall biosynthesis|nr:glycosyltransferase [Gemmataceae bacterium]